MSKKDYLCLKWGTLKGWRFESESAKAAGQRLFDMGERCMSVAMQKDTDEQKKALCELIDSLDCDTVELDWEGKDVSKEEAKKYVMEYGKK